MNSGPQCALEHESLTECITEGNFRDINYLLVFKTQQSLQNFANIFFRNLQLQLLKLRQISVWSRLSRIEQFVFFSFTGDSSDYWVGDKAHFFFYQCL